MTCSEEHCFNSDDPICVFITDQAFPPSLPSDEGRCCVVLRLEDCLLSEQPGILKEFFGARAGYLPEGSELFFGLLSHLALRGLENYAEETVKMLKVFSNMLKSGCSVAHVVLVPLGSVPSAGLVRDLYDLDSWLRSGVVSNLMSLPASREALWRMLEHANKIMLSVQAANAERVMYMLENIKTSSKIHMISGEIENLPASISPMTEKDKQHVMEQTMREIADTYAIDINKYPNLSRCNGAPVFDDDSSSDARIFVIGASHAVRLVGGLAEKGLNIINLAKAGWKFDDETSCEIGQKLQNYGAGKDDCLIIDPLSNSIFCGSDSDSKHRSGKRGRYMACTWQPHYQVQTIPQTNIAKIKIYAGKFGLQNSITGSDSALHCRVVL
jgi:hypothetical protein